MRCNNCGWDETNPNVTTCVKCGHPLESASMGAYSRQPLDGQLATPVEEEEIKKTRVFDGNLQSEKQQLKQTVVQGVMPLEPQQPQQPDLCPRCGYPMVRDYCANCGYNLEEVEKPEDEKARRKQIKEDIARLHALSNTCSQCGEQVPGNYRFCPKCGAPIELKTINPFDKPRVAQPTEQPTDTQPLPHFHLTPIMEESEIEDEKEPYEVEAREFEGFTITLKRDNTEPGNRTITSKEQAMLTFEDGEWVIENRSEHCSTLVVAGRKIVLKNGDIIMLGDRRFRFEAVDKE